MVLFSLLVQHVAFFDGDCDGVIWPYDTFFGFGTLGFGLVISALAVAIIHGPFSYPTLPTTGKKLTDWLPDPFMRIYVANIQRCKHGSDTENYDRRGHFQPNKFEEMLNSYSSRHMKDSLSFKDALVMVVERRDLMDFFGVFAFLFEWLSTYMLLWPSDGECQSRESRSGKCRSLILPFPVTRLHEEGRYAQCPGRIGIPSDCSSVPIAKARWRIRQQEDDLTR